MLAAKIDQIGRFQNADKLCAYAGVVPTTHSSGSKTHHRRLLPSCNKWLRRCLGQSELGRHRLPLERLGALSPSALISGPNGFGLKLTASSAAK